MCFRGGRGPGRNGGVVGKKGVGVRGVGSRIRCGRGGSRNLGRGGCHGGCRLGSRRNR